MRSESPLLFVHSKKPSQYIKHELSEYYLNMTEAFMYDSVRKIDEQAAVAMMDDVGRH